MSAFKDITYSLLGAPMFDIDSILEPGNWSGTNPPHIEERVQLKENAETALNSENPKMDNDLFDEIWDDPGTEFEIDHVIIGAGYAAVINAATLPNGFSSRIMIGKSEPWSTYKVKLMGQSPTNLSPSAFPVLPLHLYGLDYPGKPQNCLNPLTLFNCYLSSEYFSLALALSRYRLGIPALKGIVQSINTQASDYLVTVIISKGNQEKTVTIKTRNLDIASGPGPPRKLPDNQFDDENVRKKLRIPANGFKRHLFGSEALKEQENLPPSGEAKKILIYGGSPTSAWVYERIFEVATIFEGDMNAEPYEVIWVAPLRWQGEGEDDLTSEEKKKVAFGAIDIGLRNKMVLKHSKDRRFVAEITDVEEDGDLVKVKLNRNIGGYGNEIHVHQIIESIGLDPNQPGGVNHILSGFEGSFDIIQDSYGDRPLGLVLNENQRQIRILGAAAFAAASTMLPGSKTQHVPGVVALSDYISDNMLLTDEYANKMRAFLESLPEETRVPPGITVAGITISRANNSLFAQENNININTASLEELKSRTIDTPNETQLLFTNQEAEMIVECRKNMSFAIPPFPGQPQPGSDDHWIPGFISIHQSDIESCDDLELEDYDRIKSHIRV